MIVFEGLASTSLTWGQPQLYQPHSLVWMRWTLTPMQVCMVEVTLCLLCSLGHTLSLSLMYDFFFSSRRIYAQHCLSLTQRMLLSVIHTFRVVLQVWLFTYFFSPQQNNASLTPCFSRCHRGWGSVLYFYWFFIPSFFLNEDFRRLSMESQNTITFLNSTFEFNTSNSEWMYVCMRVYVCVCLCVCV